MEEEGFKQYFKLPEELIAHISADSKYWLYINGENVVLRAV